MNEPSIEEIVAHVEYCINSPFEPDRDDIRALVASWRERGEALNAKCEELEHARAALDAAIKFPADPPTGSGEP